MQLDDQEFDGPQNAIAADVLNKVPVRVRAVLARRRVPIGELAHLKVGSEMVLERRIGEPVEIMVDDRLIGWGELVKVDDGIGVSITEVVKD